MYLWSSTVKSFSCAVLTAACATSTSMPPSSRRPRAVRRAPSGGTLVWASQPANYSYSFYPLYPNEVPRDPGIPRTMLNNNAIVAFGCVDALYNLQNHYFEVA